MDAVIPGLGMKLIKAPISAGEVCYRPPAWPPPENWVVSEDRHGNAVSLWRDPFWDFSSWAGSNLKLDFVGGRHSRSAPRLSPANQHILRLLTTWLIWVLEASKAGRRSGYASATFGGSWCSVTAKAF